MTWRGIRQRMKRERRREHEEALLKTYRWLRCEFGPDETECDECGRQWLQLWFRSTDCCDCREGEYRCYSCVLKDCRSYENFDPEEDWMETGT